MNISYEQIAKRAFEIWNAKGQPEGREQEHWFQAEAELQQEQENAQRGRKTFAKSPTMARH